MRSAGYHEEMIGRTYFGGDQVTQLNVFLYNTIKLPYQPKHSPGTLDGFFGEVVKVLWILCFLLKLCGQTHNVWKSTGNGNLTLAVDKSNVADQ